MHCVSLKQASVAALLTLGLCGCGSASPGGGSGVASQSPDAILSAALRAANGAHAVHVAGSIVSGGTPITLDMHLTSGAGGRGSMSENGLSFELVNTANTVYVKGSPEFWRRLAGPTAAQRLRGKWLRAPASNASFAALTALTDFHHFFTGVLSSHGTLTKGSETTVNGQRAVALNDSTQGGTLYVAATGTPYPLALAKRGKSGGRVVFDSWNESVSITPPAGAIDLKQLSAGG